MHQYVKRDGAGSPQPARPDRRAIAANAKVQMSKGRFNSHKQAPSVTSGIPSRGIPHAQKTPVIVQQDIKPGHPVNLKHDPYDTDLESIDTTVNQSVVQVEDIQQRPELHDEVKDFVADSDDITNDENLISDFQETGDPLEDYALTDQDVALLQSKGMQDVSRREAVAYVLSLKGAQSFRTIDGDSYPTTTEGDPAEWDDVKEESSDDIQEIIMVSPSPQRPAITNQRPEMSQPLHLRTYGQDRTHNMQGHQDIFQQSAGLRVQQRLNFQPSHGPVKIFNHNGTPYPFSEPPTYTQAQTNQVTSAFQKSHARGGGAGSASNQDPGSHAPSQGPIPSAGIIPVRVPTNPTGQLNYPVPTAEGTVTVAPDGDYDRESLLAMNYKQLKDESFDVNPRSGGAILSNENAEKSLVQRLQFVQKNLNAEKQSDFFGSLSTDEWEDAGDWFLEQFGSIIRRTQDARQAKRKLAREFEEEVEKRYKHVSKKQQQVEEAMNKMKAQGEGIVPKTPRPSKNPNGK